ncbi:uncharacterized protein KD926_007637 [Aspergillus affinis]|uniref:uncharacterized protein n=1 Tax=Aspergillus affinis TaxID=1070780 RepID=UPI0022FE4CEF|nr:uncharacterized protein KD926_007637 [Aspergillus affinis]KAI9040829.1 hypothetical protein KD926_007637 [Aspergillus affinis]
MLAAAEPSPPSDIISVDIPWRLTFLALIEDFKPVSLGGIFSGDRISRDDPIYSSAALCIRALLPLTSLRIDSLNLSIFSLLTTYMGNLKIDTKLAQLAQSSYTSALKKSHPHIQKVIGNGQPGTHPKANLELILLLAIAFLAFEFVNENEYSEAALLAHIGGVLSILELYRPHNFSSPHMRQAFSGFRGIFLSVRLSKHNPTFLADSDWIRLPFLNVRKTRMELLHDITLQIPWLFYQTDRWFDGLENYASNDPNRRETSDSPKQNIETALSLLKDYWAVFDQMEEWQNNWKASEQGPLYWHSGIPISSKVIDVDSVCIPSFPDQTYQVRFQNTQKAGIAATFWSFRLELLMGMIKLQRSLLGTQVESLEQNLAMAEETACLILQTTPYLTCCFEARRREGILRQGIKLESRRRDLETGFLLEETLRAEHNVNGLTGHEEFLGTGKCVRPNCEEEAAMESASILSALRSDKLKDSSQWRAWHKRVKAFAVQRTVWDLCNPDTASHPIPLSEPIEPEYPQSGDQEEKKEWRDLLEVYKIKANRWENQRKGLDEVNEYIITYLDASLRDVVLEYETPYERLVYLSKRFARSHAYKEGICIKWRAFATQKPIGDVEKWHCETKANRDLAMINWKDSRKSRGGPTLGPSDSVKYQAQGLRLDEISQLRKEFVTAALRAQKAGHDGVENRSRLLFEVIHDVREVCRPDFQIGMRLSLAKRYGIPLAEYRMVSARALMDDALDYLDLALDDYARSADEPPFEGRSPQHAATVLDAGLDFVMVGRAAILNPNFPNDIQKNHDYRLPSLPVPASHLKEVGLSEPYLKYMTAWPGFVTQETGGC